LALTRCVSRDTELPIFYQWQDAYRLSATRSPSGAQAAPRCRRPHQGRKPNSDLHGLLQFHLSAGRNLDGCAAQPIPIPGADVALDSTVSRWDQTLNGRLLAFRTYIEHNPCMHFPLRSRHHLSGGPPQRPSRTGRQAGGRHVLNLQRDCPQIGLWSRPVHTGWFETLPRQPRTSDPGLTPLAESARCQPCLPTSIRRMSR
jgi:hypothetical protein